MLPSALQPPAGAGLFAERVIDWQKVHGRHDLPWQNTRDPYRIWVSEIMLQQTQVAAVIPYYRRFIARFPDVATLADASEQDVLEHWSGLGYYARGRNLHGAARIIVQQYGGAFPNSLEAVRALPGIGRSTAAAICAFAFGERAAILDGNVKRVLARHQGIPGFPGDKHVQDALWQRAEALLPDAGVEPYTQGLMDLGANICVRRKPACTLCPVAADCIAQREGSIAQIPAPRPAKVLPERETTMLVLWHAGEVLLQKRPSIGIWGGLWSFPEAQDSDIESAVARLGLRALNMLPLALVDHGFTHFKLRITPVLVAVSRPPLRVSEDGFAWLSAEAALASAIPAPVKQILVGLHGPDAQPNAQLCSAFSATDSRAISEHDVAGFEKRTHLLQRR
ncbi:MAG: A/G-specific adenine glycosylase [Betaproteobacteria bacterium]